MKLPLISIIIVNWNGGKWLKKCMDSLIHQTYIHYEIIFVDNASTDDSVKFIKNNYPSVKIIDSNVNLGFSGGNNLGIKKAKGEYILLLNNDTWVRNDFLGNLFNDFIKSECDIMGPIEGNYYTQGSQNYSIQLDPLGHFIYLYGSKARKEDFYLSGVCLLFRKSFYKETRGLDDNYFMYAEDCDWFWRLHLLNKKICKNNNVVVYHKSAGNYEGKIKYLSFLWRNENTLQMLIKNYSLYNLIWVLPFYILQNIIEITFFLLILKPKISFSYVEGWLFNLKNIRKTLRNRRWVQENRRVSDFEIMKKMFLGPAKLYHIISFVKATND